MKNLAVVLRESGSKSESESESERKQSKKVGVRVREPILIIATEHRIALIHKATEHRRGVPW